MNVLGLISGTSMDGVDAAAVAVEPSDKGIACRLLDFETTPYAPALRDRLLGLPQLGEDCVAELSSLNFEIGAAFGAAAHASIQRVADIVLVGSHGQTVFHEPRPAGTSARVSSTLQLGEPALIAERTGLTTVADFRVAEVAAGGHGAPLVSYVDYLLLRSDVEARAVLNIGGIANLTLLPAGCGQDDVRAFDTGPGNMLIDAAVRELFPESLGYDADGKIGASGVADTELLGELLDDPYFSMPAPKTAGREQFGETFFRAALQKARSRRCAPHDFVATLTALTARTIAQALPSGYALLLTSGGGIHNQALMAALERELRARREGPRIARADEFGMDADAKEAMAFAVLAHEALHGRFNTLPNATGGRHAAVVGKIVPGANFSHLMRSIFGANA